MTEINLDLARQHAEEIIKYEGYQEMVQRDPSKREAAQHELATLVLARLGAPGDIPLHEAVFDMTREML